MSRLVAALLAFALPFSALAQTGEPERFEKEPDRVVTRMQIDVDFSDHVVTGQITKPNGVYVLGRRRPVFESLVKVRGDFAPELLRSVDGL